MTLEQTGTSPGTGPGQLSVSYISFLEACIYIFTSLTAEEARQSQVRLLQLKIQLKTVAVRTRHSTGYVGIFLLLQ